MERNDSSARDEAELARWLGADSRRRGAYARASAAMHLVDRATDTDDPPTILIDPVAATRLPSLQRRWLIGGGLAAVTTGALTLAFGPRHTNEEHLSSAFGEIKRVPLEDGSVVVLNTATRITARFEPNKRLIDLDEGEGWFQVAEDTARPFLVNTGFALVRAVGTAFSLRKRSSGLDILVTEGVVELSGMARDLAKVLIRAGNKASVSDQGVLRINDVSADDLSRHLAWQMGRISVNGETLQAAAAEFNRYNRVKISVDPALASATVVGVFDCNDPVAFARSAAITFGADVIEDAQTIRLSRRTK
jgi:transmembrane sensor